MFQCLNICSSCGNFVKGAFQCTCLVMVHTHGVPKQKPLGLERNGGQQEEMVEAEEELYMGTGFGDEHGLAWTRLGECSQ
jgi:hypothetical protein